MGDLLYLMVGLISVPVLPSLLQDVIGKADKWGNDGKNGRIDPFVEVFDVSTSLVTFVSPDCVLSDLFSSFSSRLPVW